MPSAMAPSRKQARAGVANSCRNFAWVACDLAVRGVCGPQDGSLYSASNLPRFRIMTNTS